MKNKNFNSLCELIDSKNIENIKLALVLVQGQKFYKEFRDMYNVKFSEYKKVFNNIVLPMNEVDNLSEYQKICGHIVMKASNKKRIGEIVSELLNIKLRTDKLDSYLISYILMFYPKLHIYFDLNLLEKEDVTSLITIQPIFISILDRILEMYDSEELLYLFNGNRNNFDFQLKMIPLLNLRFSGDKNDYTRIF